MERLQDQDIEKVLKENDKVILKFSASWCSSCKSIQPILEKMEELNPNVKFIEIDADSETTLVSRYSIKSLPTLVSFSKGSMSNKLVGNMNITNIKSFIQQV